MSSAYLIRLRIACTDLDQSLRQPLHLADRHQHYTPLPIVLAYIGFVLRVMRGRVRLDEVKRHQALY
jgi:hypothetical protein